MVQRKFHRFAGFILHIQHLPHDYSPITNALNIETLVKRRHSNGLKFLNGLLSGKIDSPFLLNLINFKVPQRTSRHSVPFYILPYTSNYLANEPITRLLLLANVDTSQLALDI
jgi:hypothetical protein